MSSPMLSMFRAKVYLSTLILFAGDLGLKTACATTTSRLQPVRISYPVLPTSTRGVFSRLKQLKSLCKLKESSYPFSTKLLSRRMCMTTASQNKDDCRVRVEATRRGGKMLTLIRGLVRNHLLLMEIIFSMSMKKRHKVDAV